MSSLKDLASLIMIPSLYKDGELHTVKPLADENIIIHPDATDNNDGVDGSTPTTSSNFTFSRGSNLAATRVDVNGLIEKGRENLYTQSNNFSHSDWTPKAGTFVQGVADPNGGTDAWSWTATNTDPYLYQNKSISGVYCLSIYVKGVGSTIGEDFQIRVGAALKDVTLTGDWQRVQHFGVLSGSTNIGFEYGNPATANDVVHIYAAQLEQGLVATDYIETGASTAQAGILEDMPRLDYSGGASCPALLLEPQRTNLVGHSEYFGAWNKSTGAITITSNYGVSPEGLQNSSRVQFTSSSQHINISTSLGIGVTSTGSVYIKGTAGETIQFDTGGAGALKTLTGNWQRIEVTSTSVSSLLLINTFAGATARDIEVWGAQMEEGNYPTSYIPTYGTSQTRSGESASVLNLDTNNIVGDTQWSFLAEFDVDGNAPSTDKIRLTNATNMPRVYLYNDAAGFAGGWSGAMTAGQNRVKVLWRLNTLRSADIFAVGAKQVSVTAQPSDLIVDRLLLNGNQGTFKLYNITIFPTALTDSECIALTTL